MSNNGSYNHPGMTQSAFGGFNFGMNSNANGLNLPSNCNQNLSFNRSQTVVNKDSLIPQINMGPNF